MRSRGSGPADPQSLNRYAYVLNNPTSLVDPSGLDPCDKNPGGRRCSGFNDAVGSGINGSCYVDGLASGCGFTFSQLSSGIAVQCPNNFCSGFAALGNTGFSALVQFTAQAGLGGSGYDVIAQPIPDPTLSINQINAAYQLGCQYGTRACGSNDSVSVRYVGTTQNVQILDNPLNTSAASADGYQDPSLFNAMNHPGATSSYYIGGGYIGIDAGHVVDLGAGLEAHIDSFAPYNPLHWIFEWLPSQFINTRGNATPVGYTCSVNGGCH